MTFTSILVIVITSGVAFTSMGYAWGKKDSGRSSKQHGKHSKTKAMKKSTFKVGEITLKAVKDKGEGCEQCFFGSYIDCDAERRKYGLPECYEPNIRFIMVKNKM